MKLYTYKEIRETDHFGDGWWEHFILKPFVYRLTLWLANYTEFTPNQITIMSFIFSVFSAYLFLNGTWNYLIMGALLFEFGFILDCTDGRIARLKGLKSAFGAYFDVMTDFLKYFLIILCLAYGQYLLTKDVSFLLYGYIFMFSQLALFANTYIIRFNQPELDKGEKDIHQVRYDVLNNKLPIIVKLKTKLDPDNKLSYIPNNGETIAFFIAPIMVLIKLGFIFGTIISLINIFALIMFNFVINKKD